MLIVEEWAMKQDPYHRELYSPHRVIGFSVRAMPEAFPKAKSRRLENYKFLLCVFLPGMPYIVHVNRFLPKSI